MKIMFRELVLPLVKILFIPPPRHRLLLHFLGSLLQLGSSPGSATTRVMILSCNSDVPRKRIGDPYFGTMCAFGAHSFCLSFVPLVPWAIMPCDYTHTELQGSELCARPGYENGQALMNAALLYSAQTFYDLVSLFR